MEKTDALSLPGKAESIWVDTTPATDYPPLGDEEVSVDVAVIGGGIAGLTTAALLKDEGRTVAVVESERIISGATGYTTAKVTSAHGLIYSYLVDKFGRNGARLYADANQSAIEKIASLVRSRKIDCGFSRLPMYVYSESPDDVQRLEAEAAAAGDLGLPASFTTEVPLPFETAGAVRVDHQAQFHPRKYLLAVSERIPGDGSFIFEKTRAIDIDDGEPCLVVVEGGSLKARAVVVATRFPFYDRGIFFMRITQTRSYALAFRSDRDLPGGMFYEANGTGHSFRSLTEDGVTECIVSGEDHRAGRGGDTVERYRRLEQYSAEHYGAGAIDYRWSTQDNYTVDRVPYIGRHSPLSKHIFVATGFGGWGMTGGTVAGMVLTDVITGRTNEWVEVFDPTRLKTPVGSIGRMTAGGGTAARQFIQGHLSRRATAYIETLPAGDGRVLQFGRQKIAVYKDEDGEIHALSPRCTHMGCLVNWNNAERTWDCPCHGSRFTYDGRALNTPAYVDLPRVTLE